MQRLRAITIVVAIWSLATCLALDVRSVQAADVAAQNVQVAQAEQAAPAQADAATTPNNAPNAAQPTDAGGLQEVVVTAERRAEDVQSTPIVIVATSASQLQEEHVQSVTDLQFTVPTLTINTSGDFLSDINIRGVGQVSQAGPAVTLGVEVLTDGMMAGEVTTQSVPFFDMRDTEVLEGPQGVLGGGSSTGGEMVINSADPNFRGLNGYVETTLANYMDQKVDGAVNLPVNDTFAVRLAFNEESRNSFYRNEGANSGPGNCCQSGPVNEIYQIGDVDDKDVRIGMLWKPSNNFQIQWKFQYDNDNHGGVANEPVPTAFTQAFALSSCGESGPNSSIVCGPLGSGPQAHTTFWYPGEQPYVLNYGNLLSNSADGGSTENEYQFVMNRYMMDLRYTLPDGIQIRSVSGMEHQEIYLTYWQSDSPANDGYNWHIFGPNVNHYQEEIDILSPTTGKLTWVGGAFWFYRTDPVPVTAETVLPPYSANELPSRLNLTDPGSLDRIAAVFGNVTYQFTDAWQGQLGVRENWDNSSADEEPWDAQYIYPYGPGNTLPGTPAVNCQGSNVVPVGGSFLSCNRSYGHWEDKATTGKVDVNYTPAPGQNFYAFFARGYKAGAVANSDATVNPEYLSDYELGWKGRLAEGHVVLQTGLYYMVYQGMQLNLFDIYTLPAPTSSLINAATSTIKGLEVSAQSQFGGFGFELGFDYNDSRMGNVDVANPAFFPTGVIPGTTAAQFNTATGPAQCGAVPTKGCFNYLPYQQNVSGEQMIMAPTYTGHAAVHYSFPVGAGALQPLVSYSYSSSQYGNIFQEPYYYVAPRHILGANLTYTNGDWLAELYGTNLTNLTYIQSFAGGYANLGYGASRQFGVRFQYTFGGPGAGGGGG